MHHAGHDASLLNPDIDRLFIDALRRSPCKIMVRAPDGQHVEIMLSAENASLDMAGTRCYMNLESTAPELARRLKPGAADGAVIDRVNAYVSQPGHGTPVHFDVRTVWIVQLFGNKIWRVADTAAIEHPTRNCVLPHGQRHVQYEGQTLQAPTRMRTHVLSPGDWLRVPKGVWHETTTAVGSVSTTLAEPEGA